MTVQKVVELAQKNYSGPIVAGVDLMVFHLGRKGVTVISNPGARIDLAQLLRSTCD